MLQNPNCERFRRLRDHRPGARIYICTSETKYRLVSQAPLATPPTHPANRGPGRTGKSQEVTEYGYFLAHFGYILSLQLYGCCAPFLGDFLSDAVPDAFVIEPSKTKKVVPTG